MEWPPVVAIIAFGEHVSYSPPGDLPPMLGWNHPACVMEVLPKAGAQQIACVIAHHVLIKCLLRTSI